MQRVFEMNWNDPKIRLSLKQLQETFQLQGRDSRIVRAAFAYSRWKKSLPFHFPLFKKTEKNARLKVLFVLAGGVGDMVCAKFLTDRYLDLLPNADIDVFASVPEAARMLLGTEERIKFLSRNNFSLRNYDLAVYICLTVKFLRVNRIALKEHAPQFIPILDKAQTAQKELGCLLDDPYLTEGILGKWLCEQGGNRFDFLSYLGGIAVQTPSRKIKTTGYSLEHWGLEGKKYITFHDGMSEVQFRGKYRPTRAWPPKRWIEFLEEFKKVYPDILCVQLGGKNSPVYSQADMCLVGKTRWQDIPVLLENSLLHVDTESGLVHLAALIGTRSVVLFGPSEAKFLSYTGNKNISSKKCGGCMWILSDWMNRCALGEEVPPCMEDISAADVLHAVEELLNR